MILSLLEKLLILPAHLWVWVINHKVIPDSVWDRLTDWRTRK
ncbi:hypothetical protein [Brevibacterium permense]|uniref:Uncharacterized protein n=1 Tax=Brevibacterium permense TaxID=234834 RepID=A0ABN2A8B6_9MICO|nr:hypothetical protein [Brevibacterium permense]